MISPEGAGPEGPEGPEGPDGPEGSAKDQHETSDSYQPQSNNVLLEAAHAFSKVHSCDLCI